MAFHFHQLRRTLGAVLALLLAVALPASTAAQGAPGPTTRHEFRVAGLPVDGPAEVFTALLDMAPGDATPPHTHPGQVLGTMLEGAMTFRTQGEERVYRVGETIIEVPNEVGTALNLGATR